MSLARFRVAFAKPLDGAREATVTIDRTVGLFTVRLLRRRRSYTLPLSFVAERVVWQIERGEALARARERRARRLELRRARRLFRARTVRASGRSSGLSGGMGFQGGGA